MGKGFEGRIGNRFCRVVRGHLRKFQEEITFSRSPLRAWTSTLAEASG
jgi:hypothetical protein